MMGIRKQKILGAAIAAIGMMPLGGMAQGVHFSQFYNAPLIASPANTGFINEDYRLGVNYRTQWSKVPVPFNTFGAFSDMTLYSSAEGTNHLAMGISFLNDAAGDGKLKLTRGDFSLAYHVNTDGMFFISAGLGAGYATRSVDYNKLTFDMQWDGLQFDKSKPNGEQDNIIKSSYLDVNAGINVGIALSPAAFVQLGGSVTHLNQPTESFYNQENQLGIRPTAYLEAQLQLENNFLLAPSVYYTTQRGASEILAGTLLKISVADKAKSPTKVVVGGYYRLNESIIPALGLEFGGLSFTSSYDYAMSGLGKEIKGNGAMEFSIIYRGSYTKNPKPARHMGCENPNRY